MIRVFIPMTWPRVFSSGPPEFPGLMAASVWIMSTPVPCWPRVRLRPLAETTPTLRLFEKLKGLPMAMTQSPTSAASESPSSSTVRGSLGSILMMATSVRASLPRTFAS